MKEFFESHKDFILTILPDFLHNKWTIMVINIIIFLPQLLSSQISFYREIFIQNSKIQRRF